NHGVAAAIDHDDRGGVATPIALLQRGLRNRQRDRVAQLLAPEELRARGCGDGAGEGDEGEADGRCGHGSILLVAAVFCFWGNSASRKSIPFPGSVSPLRVEGTPAVACGSHHTRM